jgi:predicted dinucleotide-binding enzyme
VRFADVVVLASRWVDVPEALEQVGATAPNKILWDCTNALKPDLSGLLVGTDTSGGEEIAKLAPWATVVKAIPPFAETMHSPSMLIDGKRSAVFVCGDDREARAVVAKLVGDIDAEPIDAGPLALARYTEPAGMLLVQLAYASGFGSRIGLSLLREKAAG